MISSVPRNYKSIGFNLLRTFQCKCLYIKVTLTDQGQHPLEIETRVDIPQDKE